VLGREIRQMKEPRLANVRGAALLTLLTLGCVSLEEIPSLVEVERRFAPDSGTAAAGEYDLLFEQFVALYKQNKGIYRRLNSALIS
jgi:sugar (pentulose or hexulose) kinase